MKKIQLWAAALMLGMAMTGCSNTAEGVKEDTEKNAEAASKTAEGAMDNTKDAADSAGAAMGLTPRLKTAITADAELNDARNTINIDSNDTTVTIDGTVYSDAMKTKAESVVKATMKEANATQTVVNNLTVAPAK